MIYISPDDFLEDSDETFVSLFHYNDVYSLFKKGYKYLNHDFQWIGISEIKKKDMKQYLFWKNELDEVITRLLKKV